MTAFSPDQQQELSDLLTARGDDLRTLIRQLQGLVPRTGTGSPESVVAAPVGTLYRRLDGGASTSLYVKETGTGNTGWVAK